MENAVASYARASICGGLPAFLAVEFSPGYGHDVVKGPVSVLASSLEAFMAEMGDDRAFQAKGVYFAFPDRIIRAYAGNKWSANTGKLQSVGVGPANADVVWLSADPADHKTVWR